MSCHVSLMSKNKKKSWFSLVKRIFVSDKNEKRRKWVFGGFKVKKLPAPQKRLSEAEDEQNKPALTMKANEITEPVHQVEPITQSSSSSSSCSSVSTEESAATRIQTAFRGYLARKALEALKGIVKLQALIRGRAVRRQSFTTLKCLQSIINIQTQACARRFQTSQPTHDDNKHWHVLGDKLLKMELGSERRWDDSTLSKKNSETLTWSKKEAAIKRERMKEYSFLHRNSAESERNKVNGRLRYWLEQWVDTQLSKSKELEDLDTIRPSRRYSEEFGGTQQFRFRNNPTQGLDMNMNMSSPVLGARRSSQHTRQQDRSNPSSPTYMAATQSARAKARSVSTPKQRVCDTCSQCYSPYKNKLFLVPSSRPGGAYYHQNPLSKMGKDLSFDSECSIPNYHFR